MHPLKHLISKQIETFFKLSPTERVFVEAASVVDRSHQRKDEFVQEMNVNPGNGDRVEGFPGPWRESERAVAHPQWILIPSIVGIQWDRAD